MSTSRILQHITIDDINLCKEILSKAKYDEEKQKFIVKEEDYQDYHLTNAQFSLLCKMAKRINDEASLKIATGIECQESIGKISIIIERTAVSGIPYRIPYKFDSELFKQHNELQKNRKKRKKISLSEEFEEEHEETPEEKAENLKRFEIEFQIAGSNYEAVKQFIDMNWDELETLPNCPEKNDVYIIGYELLIEYLENCQQFSEATLRRFISQSLIEGIKEYIMPTHGYDTISINDILDMEDPESEERLIQACLNRREIILKVIDTLESKAAKEILMYAYGFIDGKEHTDEEIANKYGICRQAAQQKRNKFLRQLTVFVRGEILADLLPEDKKYRIIGGLKNERSLLERKLLSFLPKEDFLYYISEFTEEEQMILKLYYGLIDRKPLTLLEIAKKLNSDRNEINKISVTAHEKLRNQIKKQIKSQTPESIVYEDYLRFLMKTYVYTPKQKNKR